MFPCLITLQQHLALINKNVRTVKDVPAHEFIAKLAEHLKKNNRIKMPNVSEVQHSISSRLCLPD